MLASFVNEPCLLPNKWSSLCCYKICAQTNPSFWDKTGLQRWDGLSETIHRISSLEQEETKELEQEAWIKRGCSFGFGGFLVGWFGFLCSGQLGAIDSKERMCLAQSRGWFKCPIVKRTKLE